MNGIKGVVVRFIVRMLRTLLIVCSTLAMIAALTGWALSYSRSSWTLNPDGLTAGLYDRGTTSWQVLATFDRGWLCLGCKAHTTPKWPDDWECGGGHAVPFDGMTRIWSCPDAHRSGWPVPMGGRWKWFFRRDEEEVVDWIICRTTGEATEVFDVEKNHAEWLKARLAHNVWATPGRVQKHIALLAAIPFWAIAAFAGLLPLSCVTKWVVRHRRKRCAGATTCLHCKYDLTGNVSGVCPECGTPSIHSSELTSKNQ